jgi:hypothetical protein
MTNEPGNAMNAIKRALLTARFLSTSTVYEQAPSQASRNSGAVQFLNPPELAQSSYSQIAAVWVGEVIFVSRQVGLIIRASCVRQGSELVVNRNDGPRFFG